MRQARLKQDDEIIFGWIDKGDKGNLVEVKGRDGLWEVLEIYDPPIDDKWLSEKRQKDRRGLTSIKR